MSRLSFLIALLSLCSACEDRSPPPAIDQSVRPARVMTVEFTNRADTIELVGRIEPVRSIDLAFEVSGPLHQLPVREGQAVKEGELLAALDQADFQLAVREAEVQLRLAQQDLDRKQKVLKQRGIARSAVDDARTMRDLQRVRLTQARQKLADATLHAPFDALVARRFVDSFVNVNAAQPVVRLHAAEELFVVANVPEHLSATISPDDVENLHATFSFTGDERFPLEFRENRGEADRIAQSIEVSFAMRRSEKWNLMPGMTATVHILLKKNGITSVLVPLAAVVADEEQQLFVWVVDPTTQAVSRKFVTVSETKADGAVLTDGVTEGDIIVTTGAATLREGVRVRPMDDSERA